MLDGVVTCRHSSAPRCCLRVLLQVQMQRGNSWAEQGRLNRGARRARDRWLALLALLLSSHSNFHTLLHETGR